MYLKKKKKVKLLVCLGRERKVAGPQQKWNCCYQNTQVGRVRDTNSSELLWSAVFSLKFYTIYYFFFPTSKSLILLWCNRSWFVKLKCIRIENRLNIVNYLKYVALFFLSFIAQAFKLKCFINNYEEENNIFSMI